MLNFILLTVAIGLGMVFGSLMLFALVMNVRFGKWYTKKYMKALEAIVEEGEAL